MKKTGGLEFTEYFKESAGIINRQLDRRFRAAKSSRIIEAMRYAVMGAGKRFRPVLAMAAAEACGADPAKILPACCGIEFIHNYSLVHDDLPAMDDDDYRRGRPTVHRRFGEDIAILAGDALLTEAFRLMAENSLVKGISGAAAVEAIRTVALAAGAGGMIEGQALDIMSSKKALAGDRGLLERIYEKKTAALIEASVVAGALLAGAAGGKLSRLRVYGRNIGMAFQITDDIFDAGRDRISYVKIHGLKKSKREARELVFTAKKALGIFGGRARRLEELADFILYRKK